MAKLDDLVAAAKEGDGAAFGRLVTRFQGMAYASAYAWLNDAHLAQDAAQEAFVDAYLNLDNLRDNAAFPGWFRRFVIKHSDRVRRQKHPLPLAPEDFYAMPCDLPDPEALFLRCEAGLGVRQLVAELPEKQRETLALFYLDGYSQQEIAAFLAIGIGTVRKRLFDARKGLEKRMLDMVKETVLDNQPAADTAAKVQFFIALKTVDLDSLAALLATDAGLAHAKADLAVTDAVLNRGTTPIFWAASIGDVAMIDLLLDYGVGVDEPVGMGEDTPLHTAVMAGQRRATRHLIDKGADVNARARFDHTPLHRAAIRGDRELVELLLDHGADLAQTDAKGWTPSDWAAMKGFEEVLALLTERGARPPAEPLRRNIVAAAAPPSRAVPAGPQTLGRIIDADGAPLDGREALGSPRHTRHSIAAATAGLALATGLKAVDLFAPFKRGGHVGFNATIGVGAFLLLRQIARNIVAQYDGRIVYLGTADGDPAIQHKEWREYIGKPLGDNTVHVLAAAGAATAKRQRTVETGLALADAFCREGHEVLLIVEGQLALTDGVIPYLRTHAVYTPQAATTTLYLGKHSLDLCDNPFAFLDAVVSFSPRRADQGLFPALDPHTCRSTLLQDVLIDDVHRDIVARARALLHDYYARNLQAAHREGRFIEYDYFDDVEDVKQTIHRARRLNFFLTQAYHGMEIAFAVPGETVALADTLEGCRQILDGEHDGTPETSLRMIGAIDQAKA